MPLLFVGMSADEPANLARLLREWLRNEARLGARHVAAPAPAADAMNSVQTGPGVRGAPSMTGGPGSAPPREPIPARPPLTPPRTPAPSSGPSVRPGPIGPTPVRPAATARSVAGAPTSAGRSGPAGGITQAGALAFFHDDPRLPPIESGPLSTEAATRALRVLDEQFVRGCTTCGLHAGRKQTVFGVGKVNPELVFVGEGPGADEDVHGEPFVGRAGQLLTRMIAAMTLTRDDVFICNIVKCRPPGNRTPTEDEMRACAPYLFRQLAILRPKVIVALGRPASQTLLQTTTAISQLRGQFFPFPPPGLASLGLPTCRLMPTFHPAYLLRSPGEKTKAWEDLKMVMRELGLKVPE